MCTMDAPTPPADEQPGDGRRETPAERLDRNWNEILQELRVTQTGIQILTGFLLTVPFQQRFAELTDDQRRIYLTLVVGELGEPLLERHGEQEAREDLDPGLGDPQLLEDLVPVPVEALGGGLTAPVTGSLGGGRRETPAERLDRNWN